MKNKILSTILLVTTFLSILSSLACVSVFADEISGMKPSAKGRIKYTLTEKIDELPLTYEVTLRLTDEYTEDSSFLSSRTTTARPSFNFWVSKDGHPAFYVYEDAYTSVGITFEEINLKTNEWEHLTLVINDEHTEIRVYLNGSLACTRQVELPEGLILDNNILIGGNYYYRNFFGGEILSLALFSEERTEEEIKSDLKNAPSGDSLLCFYDFTSFDNSAAPTTIDDLSENKNDLKKYSEFYDEPVTPIEDYAYSFAIVGDVQVVNYRYPDKLKTIYNWIVENKDEKKIAFAFNLGDITDKNTAEEWANADEAIHSLDGIIPYSIVRGNHDKSLDKYKEHFAYDDYEFMIDGSYNETMLNTYQTFTVSGNKYLVLSLDFKMDYYLLDWANTVISSHPDHNVIVTTHMYLGTDGKPLDREDYGSPDKFNSGFDSEQLWEWIYSKHKNVIMVISGHISTPNILTTQREGIHGNKVAQILVDPQAVDGYFSGGAGLVAMLYFSEDGRTVRTQYYSTIRDQYFMSTNEYEFTLDPIISNGILEAPHEFNAGYNHNSEVHWSECACGAKAPTEPHTFDIVTVTKEANENELGERKISCACGYSYSEAFEYVAPPKKDNALIVTVITISALALVAGCGFLVYKLKFAKKESPEQPSEDSTEAE